MTKLTKLTKDMKIYQVLRLDPSLAFILLEMGMHCVSCPGAQSETLEEACAAHGVAVEDIIEQMNKQLGR
ncbi:MAG: DUF1858 domain-containing protein [Fastidiosipilaceae bacterium]|jgi:hydroxylamine reductase